MVSEKHCNFLINTGDATAADIESAGRGSAPPGEGESGVDLQWEIRRIGVPAEGRLPMKRVAVLLGGPSAEREVSLVQRQGLRRRPAAGGL